MEQQFDYHTHTVYSHGKGSILENAISAKAKGLIGIAITDHGFSHPFYGVKKSELERMRKECLEATLTTGVKVVLGVESNLRGESGKCDLTESDYEKLDVFSAGVHRCIFYDKPRDYLKLFGQTLIDKKLNKKPPKELVEYTTKVYVNAIKNNPIDFITHLNYLCFADVLTVAKCCADYGTLLEINTKKSHMTDEEWEKVLSTDVKFILNSDAHSPDRVGDCRLFYELDKRLNFPRDRIVNFNRSMPRLRFELYKEKL